MYLAHARHAERRRVRALAHGADRLLRLDVDDDIRLRQRVLHGALDVVGGRVTLAHRRVGGDTDHDVRELAASGLPHPQAPQLDREDWTARIAWRAASSASAGARSMSTPMLRRMRRKAATRTRSATKSAASASPFGWPARASSSPTSTATEPARSLPK